MDRPPYRNKTPRSSKRVFVLFWQRIATDAMEPINSFRLFAWILDKPC